MKDLVDFIKGFDLHTMIIIGVAFWWMNGNIDDLRKDMEKLNQRMTMIEHEISIIKTVLITKGIMPESFAHKGIDNDNSKQ